MPDGSSSAAPVTSPGPSSRSTIRQGFLNSERLVSAMNFFEMRYQPDRRTLAWDIRGFQRAIKAIHASRGYLVQPASSLRRSCHGDRHRKIPPDINAVVCCEFPSPGFKAWASWVATNAFRKDLTRRANHLHMFTIARSKPAPETGRGLFVSGRFESSDGGRVAGRHILPRHTQSVLI